MAGIVDIRMNLRDVERGMAAVKAHGEELSAVMRALKPYAKEDQREHGIGMVGPNGPWPQRKPETEERAGKGARIVVRQSSSRKRAVGSGLASSRLKIRFQRRARRLLGRLPTGIRFKAERAQLVGKSAVSWSDAHNDGPTTVGRGAVVPRREFLWFSEPFIRTAAGAIEDYVVAPWDKKSGAINIRRR